MRQDKYLMDRLFIFRPGKYSEKKVHTYLVDNLNFLIIMIYEKLTMPFLPDIYKQ